MRTLLVVGGIAGLGLLAMGLVRAGPGGSAGQDQAAEPDSVVAPRLAAADTAMLKGPRQPIFFRHDVHAGQYKIQCQYCHYSVDDASEPGIPTLQTCMGCHFAIGGTDSTHRAEIRKVREAWNQQQPIPWVRIHQIARHAHFPHMRHVQAMGPNACGTCHGDVARMAQVYQVNKVNHMGFCITCHVERNVNRDCTACHY